MLELLNESRSSLKVREINSFTLISRSCIIHKRLNEEKLHYPKKMPNSLMIVFNIVAVFFIVNDIWFVSDIWFVVCVRCSSQGRLCVAHDRSESFIGKLGFVLELAHWLWDRWPCFHRSVGGFMIITKSYEFMYVCRRKLNCYGLLEEPYEVIFFVIAESLSSDSPTTQGWDRAGNFSDSTVGTDKKIIHDCMSTTAIKTGNKSP